MSRTAFDHKDFKLNEQQEAVLGFMRSFANLRYGGKPLSEGWMIAYDLHGQTWNGVTIGDAGRRMRELRKEGVLESRKRGRFEEYRIATGPHIGTIAGSPPETTISKDAIEKLKGIVNESNAITRTVHSREEAYELEDKGWKIVDVKRNNGFYTATLTPPEHA
jgi:hypothetical protein